MKLSKRAEGVDRTTLAETFVDVGPLFTLLSSIDHQIFYGRRGTGKTHALVYLAGRVVDQGDYALYVDMRTIGSTGGLYSDAEIPIAQRATRLLMDTLASIHDGLLEQVLFREESNLAQLGPLLDTFADAISEVAVIGSVELETSRASRYSESASTRADATVAQKPSASVGTQSEKLSGLESSTSMKQSGLSQHRVHFGRVGRALQKLASALSENRLWVLLDEWSAVPTDLQPFLADLVRRSLFPVQGLTVKIAAIEQRTNLRIALKRGEYVGIEVGADAAANVNLDDFMVFENDPDRATQFFQQLLFKHFSSIVELSEIRSAQKLISVAFTQKNTFEEFVRASEGVPRDAINILSLAAQKAVASSIAIENVRSAARSWYQRDKEAAVGANPDAQALLHWIVDEVIGHRRARAFLLQSDSKHELIDALFDSRVLHLLKGSISSHDQPGVRYDSYKIDYGCYVDLLTTARAPLGLLPGEAEDYVDVPPDDYRAIRRAILDLDKFDEHRKSEPAAGN